MGASILHVSMLASSLLQKKSPIFQAKTTARQLNAQGPAAPHQEGHYLPAWHWLAAHGGTEQTVPPKQEGALALREFSGSFGKVQSLAASCHPA